MSAVADTIEYRGHTIEIKYDGDSPNPVKDWDVLGEWCVYGRDVDGLNNSEEFDSREDVPDLMRFVKQGKGIVFPVYAYIHGGIALSLGRGGQFSCPFDSGQIGWILYRKDKMLSEFGGKIFSKALKDRAKKNAEAIIETMNQWLSGDVYGYIIDDGEGDSCWGFFGMEDCIEEAKSQVDYMVEQERKKHFEQLKKWIRNKVPLMYRQPLSA